MTALLERPAVRKKKSARPPQRRRDPVSKYAQDVLDGTIVAGRAVRLACGRHFRDLKRERTKDFPYYFDKGNAQHVIDFFPTFLTLENGDPFVLPPWLQFCYGTIFGWKRVEDGLRRYQYGFFETSKGSGKSPSAGGIGLYGMAFDDEPYAEIYSAAFDKEQASIILNDAIRMAENSPGLAEIMTIDKYNIAHNDSGSFFRAVSSEHRGKSGPRPYYVLGDEIHEHRDGRVINKLLAGFKGRKQPLALLYTNSGSDRTSICWEYHQKSLDVLEQSMIDGGTVDEQWFAYISHLDACQQCFEEGYRQPRDGCDRCDDWTDPTLWMKVAPALGIVIQPKYQQDAVDAAISIPSEWAMKRRLNFCIWTETHTVWINPQKFDACKVDKVSTSNEELHPAAAGLDPASVLDLAAFCVALRHDDPPSADAPEKVEFDGVNEAGERVTFAYTLNFHVELIPTFWIPKETLNERVQKERIPYDVWARTPSPEHPYLHATEGGAIDHDKIYHFVKEAWKRFKIQRLGMDENQGRYLFMKLRDEGRLGENIVSVGQGKKLSEAFKFIEILVAHKRLWHDGHPVLAWNFANAEPHEDRLGAKWIEKPSPTKRIDGAVAAAMAIKELMALPSKRKTGVRMFFMGGSHAPNPSR